LDKGQQKQKRKRRHRVWRRTYKNRFLSLTQNSTNQRSHDGDGPVEIKTAAIQLYFGENSKLLEKLW